VFAGAPRALAEHAKNMRVRNVHFNVSV
jgi:hypothetical protein